MISTSILMCDKLVFDLSQEIEGSPNVFVRKDWINILDNQKIEIYHKLEL